MRFYCTSDWNHLHQAQTLNIICATRLEGQTQVREDLYFMMALWDQNSVKNRM
jgi:hypothetical protein